MRHIYPKNVYELQETLFEKLERFNFLVLEDNKLFKNLAIFDFESICVPTEGLKKHKLQPGLENMFQFQSLCYQMSLMNPSFCTKRIHIT